MTGAEAVFGTIMLSLKLALLRGMGEYAADKKRAGQKMATTTQNRRTITDAVGVGIRIMTTSRFASSIAPAAPFRQRFRATGRPARAGKMALRLSTCLM